MSHPSCFSSLFLLGESFTRATWGSCCLKDELDPLELLNRAGVARGGLSHVPALIFLQATEFPGQSSAFGRTLCHDCSIWRHLCHRRLLGPNLTLTGLTSPGTRLDNNYAKWEGFLTAIAHASVALCLVKKDNLLFNRFILSARRWSILAIACHLWLCAWLWALLETSHLNWLIVSWWCYQLWHLCWTSLFC